MDDLLEQFLIEGRELVAQASRDFSSLATNPGDSTALDSAFRAIHTLKGSVAIFDMAPAERLLHAAEDVLDRARKGTVKLAPSTMEGLVASLDKVDRWIDDMEESGRLPPGAGNEADQTLAAIGNGSPPASVSMDADEPDTADDWLWAMLDRHADAFEGATSPLTAFRYAPDLDCFFRGDDPLAIVSAIPDLASLTMRPAHDAWPDMSDLDPFTCYSIFEGLSSAPIDTVTAAFRLVPDQVLIRSVDAKQSTPARSTGGGDAHIATHMRVDTARVDALADGLGELIVAINAITPVADGLGRSDPTLAASLRKAQANLERVAAQLHRSVNAVRSVSLEPALRRLPRLAREIAETLGKRVGFTMSLGSLEVDKQIADGLFEPILHLLRNALDHGIESAEGRAAAGKPIEGEIRLAVRRDGDSILVTLRDDGAGIDPERIRMRAVERGLIDQQEADQLSDGSALQLIFIPGFSTAQLVTEVSGRGVGMDAVQDAIARLRGSIEVTSAVGEGTTFRLRLPINSLTTRLLVVEIAGERYGVALDQIVETVRIDKEALVPIGLGRACVLRGRTIPVLSLAQLLGGTEQDAPVVKLVVTQSGGEPVGMTVDGFAERIDTVVRPTRGVLATLPGVMGSALLGDGDVLLVLDLPELA